MAPTKDKLRKVLASEGLTSYKPTGNFVMYDLAVQDAHKGKPDRYLYRTDKDYKIQYDEEAARIKKQRSKRAAYRLTPRDLHIAEKAMDLLANESDASQLPGVGNHDLYGRFTDQVEGILRSMAQLASSGR